MNEHELNTVLSIIRPKDFKIKEKRWADIKERILLLSDQFFDPPKQY